MPRWIPPHLSEALAPLVVTLIASLGPPAVAWVLTLFAGPFHAGWIVALWLGCGVVGLGLALLVARFVSEEADAMWGYAAFLVVLVGMVSVPWVVGAMGGWTK